MYYTLERIYRNTKNKNILDAAVKKGWITKDQETQIIEAVG